MVINWNPRTHDDYDTLKGFAVYSADNEKVGTIKEVLHPQTDIPEAGGGHYFKVEPGTFKKLFSDLDEIFLPERLIESIDASEGKVILELSKDRLKQQDWSRPGDIDTFRRV